MIPTPRMPLSASLNFPVTPSVEKSVIAACDYSTQQPNTFCTGILLPNDYTSNAGVYGSLSNGYQHSPAHVSIDFGGTEGVPSVVVQRVSSQVIFTPKFSDTHSSRNSEPSNNDGQSTTVTQLQGREYISGQNNCLSPYFGVHAGIGMRSNLQQNSSSHNFQRDAPNGGLDFIGNKKQLVHEAPVSDSYLNALPYGSSSERLHRHFDQKRLAPGDGSVMNGANLTGNGSLYDIATFTGSPINNLDMDHFSIHSKSKTNSLIASEPNLQAFKQKTHIKPDMLDSPSKINMRASPFSQQLKFQHQPLQIGPPFEHNTQFVQHLAKQQTEHCPHLVGNEELHSSEFQNQFQQMTDTGDGSNAAQCQPSGVGQDISASVNSQHMHTCEQDPDSQIKFTYVSAREETESMLQEQRHPNSLEKPHILYQSSSEQPAQTLSQRIRGHDEAWRSSLSSERSTTVYPAASRRASMPQQEIYNSQRWLLFLMHARRCTFPEGKCHSVDCIKVQRLLKHMKACNLEQCPYPCCSNTKKLMKHHKSCNSQECQICVPVHCYLLRRAHCRTSDSGLLNSKKGSRKNFDARGGAGLLSETIQSTAETSEDGQSSLKRKKTELSSPYSQIKVEKSPTSILALSLPRSSGDAQKQVCPEVVKADADVMMAEPPLRSGAGSLNSCENKADKGVDSYCMKHEVEPYVPPDVEPYIPHDVEPYIPTEPDGPVRQEGMEIEQEVNQDKVEIKQECAVLHSEDAAIINLRKPKEQGVSLTEVFNPEQVREHIAGPDKQEGNIDVEQGINQANSQIQLESTVLHSEQAATMNFGKPKVQGASLTDLFNPKQVREHVAGLVKQEGIHVVQGTDQDKLQDHPATTKLAKPKVQGVSLTEIFTPEQVKEHITGLRQWIGQSKAKAEKNQAMKHSMSENSCQLCVVEKLTLEPPPIYCMHCAARIKRNTMYYTSAAAETRYYFCISCYNDTRGDNIKVYGTAICKASMEKKKNDEEIEESWVQCDKCEAWQHQICALFNGRRNDGGQAEYTCPYCYIGEIERGERKPLPQSSVLGAKDLPRTILSDHIEQRLFRRLKQERRERARVLGKHIDEVPGAESLVVRVVSSVDKKLEVKQQFLEIFQEENYPTEFPYKSKVILLFQKIEGVEVCLFGMYVQEFGSECQFPNQRRVYLSYLDSVKYFRPEIKTISGEALRTFVYHEILIGYLEYCKRRGFVSCYIWACPPVKGEDYILYCHPEIQKTPKSDKLREWYLSMLRKAAKENIVVDLTNLYDHFFVSTGECKAKVTTVRLPYFDGDYWPGAAEDFLNQLSREENEKKQQKKGKLKRIITKRSLKDVLLMRKLSTSICPMKEDFIMVHLLHSCTHCCNLMVSGNRWACNQCKNFQLCDKCHDAEDRLCERDRHPICDRDKHVLHPVEVRDVPADTKDEDEILESEFFDTRQAFLSLCQGNHYQYDTLRRAKHSSMMVLYHLHNPTAPAFVTTCNVCQNDIEAGQGWRCEICPDYDVCDVCFMKDGSVDHPHKLTNYPSIADCHAQNKEARQKRVLQLRKMLDLLVHASQCRSQHCSYTNCRRVKGLFRHGMQCKIRASRGCGMCKKMWYILKLHARACKEPECHVPRCRDLKEHLRRFQQQSDSRRRAAVMEMVRQRAEEVAGDTS